MTKDHHDEQESLDKALELFIQSEKHLTEIKSLLVQEIARRRGSTTELAEAKTQEDFDTLATQRLYCCFCGKGQDEVWKLIAGPAVFICDQCVDTSYRIIWGAAITDSKIDR